jgi:hypothetical protein
MTHFQTTARTVPTPVAATAVRTGPVLLDPRDFRQVAGGLPKGGWLVPATSQLRGTELPKGGW